VYHVVVTAPSKISGFASLGIWFSDILTLEDETIMFPHNAGNQIPSNALSELIRMGASSTALQKLKYLYLTI
jgi:hypothetical protein